MELLRPAARSVPAPELQHEVGAVARLLLDRGDPARPRRGEHPARLGMGARFSQGRLQTVVREPASGRVEIVVPTLQRGEQVVEGLDHTARDAAQPFEPGIERLGGIDAQRPVGPVGRIDPGLQAARADLRMMLERIRRIIGRADHRHLRTGQKVMHAQRRQAGVGLSPNFGRARAVQEDVHPEVALQLEMRPMVERIAQGMRHRLRPSLEFLPGRRIAGAETFVHPVRAHRPPFVVVAAEPDLGQIGELMVIRDQRRRQMAVIIVNRLPLGEFVVEFARLGRAEQEIGVDEGAGFGHGREAAASASCQRASPRGSRSRRVWPGQPSSGRPEPGRCFPPGR